MKLGLGLWTQSRRRAAWDLDALSPVLWIDPLYPGAVTYAAQPTLVNGDFSAWTGVDPDATPTGWTKAPNPGVPANHIEEAVGGCRLVSDGTMVYITQLAVQTVGHRYRERAVVGDTKYLEGVI